MGQTDQDFVIVAVEDGSTDQSLQILESLREQDDRIKIISREEKGYAITMNEALDAAQGDYVLNVDPDDWLEHDMFERIACDMGYAYNYVCNLHGEALKELSEKVLN